MNKTFEKTLYLIIWINIMIVLLLSCNQRNHSELTGNWYFFEPDSAYNEVFITDTTFLYYSEHTGIYGPFSYKLDLNKIRFFSKDYSPNFTFLSRDMLVLNYKTEYDTLRRINDIDSLLSSCKSENDYYWYIQSFYNRKCKFLYGNECEKHKMDTLSIYEEFLP